MKESFVARTTIAETNVATGVASGAYVAANAKRVALYLASTPTAAMTYSTKATAVLNNGIDIPAGTVGMWIDLGTHGTLVQQAWNLIASAAVAAGVNVFEVIRAE